MSNLIQENELDAFDYTKTKEVPCIDCEADIIACVDDEAPRCDTCFAHYMGICGYDCPMTGSHFKHGS
jgi:hypothetical protein